MALVTVGKQLYGPEIIVRAFEYLATSRTFVQLSEKGSPVTLNHNPEQNYL